MPLSRTTPLLFLLVLGPALLALVLGAGAVFDPPWLLLPLNLTFMCALPLLVSWLAAGAFRTTGVVPVLAIGGGMLALGLGSGASAILMYVDGPNAAVTVHNISVLIAGATFLVTSPVGIQAVPLHVGGRHWPQTTLFYSAAGASIVLIILATHAGALPPFFTATGFSPLRSLVLGAAILFFAIGGLSWGVNYAASRMAFVRWYATGLLLFALGLAGVMLATAPGDVVSWVGRGTQYVACTFLLAAVWQAGHQRRFAAALLHSTLSYRPLVESSAEGIMVLDRRGTLFYSNEAARRILGYDEEQAFGANLLDLPLTPAAQQVVRDCLARPATDRLEMELAARDGRAFPAEVTTYLNPTTDRLQVWSIRDISKRKQAQQELDRYREHLEQLVRERAAALQQSEERFRILASSTPDHVVEQDLNLRYTLVINPQLGLTAEQMLGKTDADLIPEDEAERLAEVKRQVIRTGVSRYFDTAVQARNGETEWFEGSYVPRRNAAGEVDGLLGYFRNVTAQKRTEQALRDSEERFRSLFNSMNEGLALHALICDATGRPFDSRFIEVNSAWVRHTGLARESVVGHTLRQVLPGSVPLIETYGHVALTGEPTHFEYYNAQLRRHYEVSVYSPAHGQFAVVLLDRTEARQRATELEAANKELETFAYSVSHDLRAPLRAVNGFVELLEEHCKETLDAEGRRLFEVIHRNSVRMASLIDDMLAFSRAGRAAIAATRVDMERLAREVADELRPGDRDVTITLHPMPAVHGDEAMLRQVWVNLLSNAIKFTAPREKALIEVGGGGSGGRNGYYVKDNGVGFDMTYSGKLFGVFQRLHPPEEFPGTGIGLAIVERIVKRHGGVVHAEGKVGEGAEFRFELPEEGPAPE